MRPVLLAVLILSLGRVLSAQSVTLRVVEDSTRQPLPGVVVRLQSGGRVVATGLTGETGRVSLGAPEAGRYQVTAARIGYEGFGPIEIEIAAGAQVHTIVMPTTARMLPPVVVTTGSGCTSASGTGTLAAALWEEVRTALTANALTASEGRVQLDVVRFERDLTPEKIFLRERIIRRHSTSGQPFVSEDPASLLARGFVYRNGDSLQYAAPDAALLLRDEFVDAHCFSARRDGPTGAVLGLSFRPVPGRAKPDVTGTLWLDATSHELRFLDFQYTGLDKEQGLGGPGGRIDFRRLPDGSWIVHDWSIFMPVVGRVRAVGQPDAAVERLRLLGWLVAGGRATVSASPAHAGDLSSIVSTVTGRAWDSLFSGPLVGAIVSIDGEADSIGTDAEGRFSLSVRGSGPRLVRVRHDRLGVVSDNSTQEVVLAPGRPAEVHVDVPSVARFAKTLCGGKTGESGVLGIVRGADGRPQEGTQLRAWWFSRGPINRMDRRDIGTSTVERGLFTFCDLPPTGVTLELDGEKTSIYLLRGQYQWVELRRRP